jgi:hypothetical protein
LREHLAARLSITDPATASRVVAVALETFGRIDTLVNNAGVFAAKPFTEFTHEDFDSAVAHAQPGTRRRPSRHLSNPPAGGTVKRAAFGEMAKRPGESC